MGAQMTSSVVIARPVSEVFAYILDFEKNLPVWATDIEYCRKTSDGPVGPGTTFVIGQKRLGKARDAAMKVVKIDPNRTIESDAEVGPLSLNLTFSLSEVEEGAQVTVNGDGELPGVLKLLAPIGARQGRRVWDARLASLKKVLEHQKH